MVVIFWLAIVLDFFFGLTFYFSALIQRYETDGDRVMAFLVATAMMVSGLLLVGAKRWYL